MPVPCIICNSELKDFAESLILNNESNNSIAETLQAKGLNVSHASVNRHKIRHMLEHKEKIELNDKGNRKYDREDSKNAFVIDMNNIKEDIKEDAIGITYDKIAESYINNHLILIKIVHNQLGIVLDLQEKYMKGETKYPNEQLRGLDTVQTMLQKSEEFTIKHLPHYKAIVDSKHGLIEHITNQGKNAKLNMKIYLKGDLFRLSVESAYNSEKTFELFSKEFMPSNPYAYEKPNYGESSYEYKFKAFKDGVLSVTSEIEFKDGEIFILLTEKNDKNKIIYLSENEYNQDEILLELKPVKRKR